MGDTKKTQLAELIISDPSILLEALQRDPALVRRALHDAPALEKRVRLTLKGQKPGRKPHSEHVRLIVGMIFDAASGLIDPETGRKYNVMRCCAKTAEMMTAFSDVYGQFTPDAVRTIVYPRKKPKI
jgi:hypothetical protein